MKSTKRQDNCHDDDDDDFKTQGSYRPPAKKVAKLSSEANTLTKKSEKVASSVSTSVSTEPNKSQSTRNCAICNTLLTEARYSEHFIICMKQRSLKLAAAAKASKVKSPALSTAKVDSSFAVPATAAASSSSSSTDFAVECAESLVLPYCPVCGRVIKTDRSYAPHLKMCAKRYNVAPDLLLELSKKQMTLQVEPPTSSETGSKGSGAPRKRQVKYFEMPNSVEDEQLQLAIALSSSVLETHVSHLPVAPSEEVETTKSNKKVTKRQFLSEPAAILKDPGACQNRLLELINERFPALPLSGEDEEIMTKIAIKHDNSSLWFELTCSSPRKLTFAIKSSNNALEMPAEFHIDTCDFELPADIADVAKKTFSPVVLMTSKTSSEAIPHDDDNTHSGLMEGAENSVNATLSDCYQSLAPSTVDLGVQSPMASKESSISQTTQTMKQVTQATTTQTEFVDFSRISANMLRLLRDKNTSDVKFLSSDGKYIGAHRLIISAHCPKLLSRTATVSSRLSKYNSQIIQNFLEFLYTGSVTSTYLLDEIVELFHNSQNDDIDSEVEDEKSILADLGDKLVEDDGTGSGIKVDSPITISSATLADEILSIDSDNDNDEEAVILNKTSFLFPANLLVETPVAPSTITPRSIENVDIEPAVDGSDAAVITGDEWLGFDNPSFDDGVCCYYSNELPLSQQGLATSEKENDLVADFENTMASSQVLPTTDIPSTSTVDDFTVLTTKKGNSVAIPKSGNRLRKTPITPFLQRNKFKSITTPPYSKMGTPHLVKLLSKYGVRKLPKKHMVLKLKEIHHVLQPKQSDGVSSGNSPTSSPPSEQTTVESKKVKKKAPTKAKRRGKFSSKFSYSSTSSEASDEEGEVTLEPNALSLLDDLEDEDGENEDEDVAIYFSQSQSVTASQAAKRLKKAAKVPKIVLTGDEFSKQVAAFIRSDLELYSDLLQFKPLPFKDIYAKVRKVGNFACTKQQLVDFLDEQCITFRLSPGKSHRPPPPPAPEKKTKVTKKGEKKQQPP